MCNRYLVKVEGMSGHGHGGPSGTVSVGRQLNSGTTDRGRRVRGSGFIIDRPVSQLIVNNCVRVADRQLQ